MSGFLNDFVVSSWGLSESLNWELIVTNKFIPGFGYDWAVDRVELSSLGSSNKESWSEESHLDL